MTWYALYTNPQCERRVIAGLIEIGFEAYCPMNTYTQRDPRTKRVHQRERPAFTRYVFVRMPDDILDWEALHRTNGVEAIVCAGIVPCRISDETIDDIRCAEDMGLLEDQEPAPVTISVGDHVLIGAGPMQGLKGRVQKRRSDQAITEIEGKRIKVPVGLLKKIA